MKKNVLEYLEDTASLYGERYAYKDANHEYTFTEVRHMARCIGSAVGQLCAGKRPVAVLMEKSGAMIISFLGIVYGGCCYCPIDITMPGERIKTILEVLKPAAVLAGLNQREGSEFGYPMSGLFL